MLNDADKKVIWKILGATVGVFVLVYMVIAPPSEVTLESIIEEINVNTVPHEPMPVDIIPENHPATSRYSPRPRKPGAAPTAG